MKTKYLSVLGSTGSIGKNCLKAAKHLGKEKVQVLALAASSNIDLLEEQIKEFNPLLVAVYDENKALELQKRVPNTPILAGMEGLIAVATFTKTTQTIIAISGSIALLPTIEAIKAKKNIGFASKEVLVSAGSLITNLVKEYAVELVPIDSELTAIFQCLQGAKDKEIQRIIITASGGPFKNYSKEELAKVTIEQALNHPNYRMGPKVTIDSSTLMNKGLEMIEASWLFNVPVEKIDVVIQKEQLIHGMVEFVDNSLLAHLCDKDMIIPIQYAITYPEREIGSLKPFDFTKFNQINFEVPDLDKFRCLKIAYESIKAGKSYSCYMNAANEILVDSFLKNKISWIDISTKLETLISKHKPITLSSYEDIQQIDKLARNETLALI